MKSFLAWSQQGLGNTFKTDCVPLTGRPLPINGVWGTWTSYSSCSVTCGQGTKKRTRRCNNPAPAHGGTNCPGRNYQNSNCNLGSCRINGVWGTWTSYSSCSVTCGQGTQKRTRGCNNPAPEHGGTNCPGQSYENRACNLATCGKVKIRKHSLTFNSLSIIGFIYHHVFCNTPAHH